METEKPSEPSTPQDPQEPVEPVESSLLTGTIIGTQYSVDYNNNKIQSTTVNTKENAFDKDYNTFFASYDRS